MKSDFEVVQNFELKRVGGALKDHSFAPLEASTSALVRCEEKLTSKKIQ